jgi:hypothetical protein
MKRAHDLRLLAGWAALSLLLCLPAPALAEAPVPFNDPALQAAVEAQLSLSDPTPTDMLALTTLDARSEGIADLSGLEYAVNLTDLDLGQNQIDDLSPLTGLTHLASLDLRGNPLHAQACAIWIPEILVNNPAIALYHDPCIRQYTLKVLSGSGGWVTSPGVGSFEYDEGSAVPVVAAADAGYHFAAWIGSAVNAGKVLNPASPNTTVTVDKDYTIQANFAADQHTLTIGHSGSGTVETGVLSGWVSTTLIGWGSFVLDHGSQVTITVTPGTGWQFAGWSGSIASSDPVLGLTLTDDFDLLASFVKNPQTLSVTSGLGGRVLTPGIGAFVYQQGTAVPIEATPNSGYRFAGWIGTLVDKGCVAEPA